MAKINSKIYARALAEVVFKKMTPVQEAKVIENFLKILIKDGQEKKAKEIINLAQDMLLKKQGRNKITFETARKMTDSQKKTMDNFVKEGDILNEKINPELIAGIKIIINGARQFDESLSGKLQNIK